MKRSILLFSLIMGIHMPVLCQQVDLIKSYGTSGPNSEGEGIVALPNGDIIMVATISLPSGNTYQEDILMIKTTSTGDTIWTKKIGSNIEYERAESLITLSNGNFLIAGNINIANGTPDALLICTDNTGNVLWEKKYGGVSSDYANSIKEVNDGIIMAGATNSFGAGNYDAWLLKTNHDGDSLWSKTFGGIEYDDSWDVELTPEGGYMLTGGNYSFASGQFDDAWLIKTTPDGDLIWRKNYGSANRVDWAWGLEPVMVLGTISGYVLVGVKNTEETMPGAANGDLHFVKVDTGGNIIWDNSIDGTTSSFRKEGMDIRQLPDGGYMIGGYQATNTARQLYMIRTDEAGTVLWDTSIGNNQAYIPRALTITPDGDCYVTGSLATPQPSQHIFLAKITGLPANIQAATLGANRVTIYPNPAKDQFHVKNSVGIDKVELYSVDGRHIKTVVTKGINEVTLDISGMPQLMLLVKVFTNDGIVTQALHHLY